MATNLREEWLTQLMPDVKQHFALHQYRVPENIRLTCGWPSKMALSRKKVRIGECWDSECTDDNHFQIFITPLLSDPIKVVGVLVHEVVHAVVGLAHGHKKPFSQCAAAVGLLKPWTATSESPELLEKIAEWIRPFGPYPNGALTPRMKDKDTQKGRMLLMECDCGLKIRTTQQWIDRYTTEWPCPCGSKLIHAAAIGE